MLEKDKFQELSVVEQMTLIMDKGYALLARKSGSVSIKLFELYGFFVEVKYHMQIRKIISVQIVNLDDVTDDYLEDIRIENIF